jgi:hypothetical protein
MKPKIITSENFEHEGVSYFVTVRSYDEERELVTADWRGISEDQKGELGYGISNCDEAISLAQQAIQASVSDKKDAALKASIFQRMAS